MKNAKAFLRCFCLIVLYAIGIYALCGFTATVEAKDFVIRDGDRVVILGDSITEQRMYSTFIEAYTLTRYPGWKLSFRNAGWSGDTAFFRSRCHTDGNRLTTADEAAQKKLINEILQRGLERDVLALKPTLVTIDFGMNDIGCKPTDLFYPIYLRCMTKMVEALKEKGVRTTLLTPQPVEEKRTDPDKDEKNLLLRNFSNGLKEISAKTGAGFVDQFEPYLKILLRERVENPDRFIGGGRDAVHPGPVGHTIMAWSILKGIGANAIVSRAQIDSKTKKVIAASGCKIENLKIADGVIRFDRKDNALPMPVHPDAGAALKLAPVLEDLNRYDLQVTGLADGDYQLSIDGELSIKASAAEWAKGCNLATSAGPITQQSQTLLKEISNKNDLYFKRWRNVQLAPIPDWAQSPEIEARRITEMTRLDQLIAESESKIDKLRQPLPHSFELKLIKP